MHPHKWSQNVAIKTKKDTEGSMELLFEWIKSSQNGKGSAIDHRQKDQETSEVSGGCRWWLCEANLSARTSSKVCCFKKCPGWVYIYQLCAHWSAQKDLAEHLMDWWNLICSFLAYKFSKSPLNTWCKTQYNVMTPKLKASTMVLLLQTKNHGLFWIY